MTIPLDPYLSLRALSAYCGMSGRKLRDLIRDPVRPLPCYRVGGNLLVRRSEFDGWMHHFRQVGTPDLDAVVDDILREFKL